MKQANAVVKDRNGAQVHMCITKLLEVEEKIWSPKYGLKGMIDATVQATLQDGTDEKRLIVPFEVKTGRNSTAAHKAQTALYTLLCSDRYGLSSARTSPVMYRDRSAYHSLQISTLPVAYFTIWRIPRPLGYQRFAMKSFI